MVDARNVEVVVPGVTANGVGADGSFWIGTKFGVMIGFVGVSPGLTVRVEAGAWIRSVAQSFQLPATRR